MKLLTIPLFGVDWCLWVLKLQAAVTERSTSAKVAVFFPKSLWHFRLLSTNLLPDLLFNSLLLA